MSLFKKVLKFVGYYLGITPALKAANWLLKSLVKIPKPGDSLQGKPVYSVAISNEYPSPGDPKPLLAGRPHIYPVLLSVWSEYEGNKQTLHIYLYVCYGIAQLRELTFAGSPLSATGSAKIQELLPGDTGTLANHSVYVNNEVNGAELVGGALDLVAFPCNVTFTEGDSENDPKIVINSDDDVFDNQRIGSRFTVSGSVSNNGEYTIVGLNGDREATVAESFVNETVDCTINIYQISISSATAWLRDVEEITEGTDEEDPSDVQVTFDHDTRTIKAPLAASWSAFRPGDLIEAYNSASNDGVDFELQAIFDEYGLVTPAPTTTVDDECSVVLVRRRLGPYVLCAPGQQIDSFMVNLVAEGGLFRQNKKGKIRAVTIGVEIYVQEIDDVGNTLGSIQSLGELEMSGATPTPQRRSYRFNLPSTGRWQFYAARTTPANDEAGRVDAIKIEAAVGFVVPGDVDPHYDATGTRVMIDLTSTSAIPQGQENKFKGVWQAYHPLLVGGSWTEPQATNDIAPFWAQLRRWQGFDVDADAYAAADAAWKAKGWQYHAYLTGASTLADATEDVLRAGDARKWYDWTRNADSIWRDRLQSTAVMMLHDGNVSSSSLDDLPYGLLPDDVATGIIAQYADARTGEDREVQIGDCETRPETVKYTGVQSRQQAWELGNRELKRRQKRLQDCQATVLWIHRDLDFGAPVLVQSYQHGLGQMAMLVSVSGGTLTVDVEFEWHPTKSHRVWLVSPDGVPSGPYSATRGSTDRIVQISGGPVGLLTGDDGGECTTVVLGYDGNEPAKALVAGIEASDTDYVTNINLVFDDDSIFDDPGDAPADQYPISGTLPDLPIDDLSASASARRITATWTPPTGTLASVAEYRLTGALSWTSVPPVIGGVSAFTVPSAGSYQVRVRAYGAGGAVGQLSDAVDVAVS